MAAVYHPLERYHLCGNNPAATLVQAVQRYVPVEIIPGTGCIRHHPDLVTGIQKAQGRLQHTYVGFAASDDNMLATFRQGINEPVRAGIEMKLADSVLAKLPDALHIRPQFVR